MSKKNPYHMYPDISYAGAELANSELMRPKARSRKARLVSHLPDASERALTMGIPVKDMTASVNLAVTSLLEKLDDITRELERTKNSLHEAQQLVDVDTLAPIANRRAFTRRLEWAISMQERYGHASSVLFFDLNGFKAINDTYGHAAGDAAIMHVADLLQRATRNTDFVARLSGDEFAVLLYHADQKAALQRGSTLAAAIAATPFSFDGKLISLASAFGVHELRRGDSAPTAMAQADAAMYACKKRNSLHIARH